MISKQDIEASLGFPLSDTAEYDADHISTVSKAAYYQGKKEATRDWAYWKDGIQYVGNCGRTLAQALALLEWEEENDS